MEPKDKYEIARAQIEHENTLVSQRITWYLTFQGFLFAAVFVAVGLLTEDKFGCRPDQGIYVAWAIYLLGILGCLSSLVCFFLIDSAYIQIGKVNEWWDECEEKKDFPRINGEGGIKFKNRTITAAHFLLVVLAVWVVLLGLFTFAIQHPPTCSGPSAPLLKVPGSCVDGRPSLTR